jgi:hypothetical protein
VKVFILVFISVFSLYGYVDIDLDGVADKDDKCRSTSFKYFVNKYGCATSLVSDTPKYSVSINNKYSTNHLYDYLNSSLLLDVSLKNYSFSFTSSRYVYKHINKIAKSDISDYYLNSSYSFLDAFNNEKLSASVSLGVAIPYKNININKLQFDSTYHLAYKINQKLNIFFAQTYTLDENMLIGYYGGMGYILGSRYYLSSLYLYMQQVSNIKTYVTYFYNDKISAKFIIGHKFNNKLNSNSVSLKLKYKIN